MLRFSVIVPIYNVQQYLRQCLDSIVGQSYQNFEVILVDDGSTDSCAMIADEYSKLYNYIKVIHQPNGGLGPARNTGIDASVGEYLVFVDGDDWLDSNYLLEMNMLIAQKSPDIIRCAWFEDNGVSCEFCRDLVQAKSKQIFLSLLLQDEIGAQVWKNVYSGSLWKNIRFPARLYEDLYTTHRVVSGAQTVVFCENAYYHYRLRTNNISNTFNPVKARDIFWGFVSRLEVLDEDGKEGAALYKKIISNAVQAIHGLSLIDDIEEIQRIASFVFEKKGEKTLTAKNFTELWFARFFTRVYVSGVRAFYKQFRGR